MKKLNSSYQHIFGKIKESNKEKTASNEAVEN